jgi:hypothetical protein
MNPEIWSILRGCWTWEPSFRWFRLGDLHLPQTLIPNDLTLLRIRKRKTYFIRSITAMKNLNAVGDFRR